MPASQTPTLSIVTETSCLHILLFSHDKMVDANSIACPYTALAKCLSLTGKVQKEADSQARSENKISRHSLVKAGIAAVSRNRGCPGRSRLAPHPFSCKHVPDI